jgi:DNA mismatch repair protein MutS
MALTFDNVDRTRLTPMMLQLIEQKERYPDCLIFFRLGDFYELFFDDAITAARELELALTARDCGLDERAPMCGVPHHAADSYLKRLLSRGYKVAICDQVEDPATAKGLVARDVVRIVTPGTQMDPESIDARAFQYLCCVCRESDAFGLAACDLSSGRFETTEFLSSNAEAQLFDELSRLNPVEFVVNETFANDRRFQNYLERQAVTCTVLHDGAFSSDSARAFGLTFSDNDILWPRASAALLTYLSETQKRTPGQIRDIRPYKIHEYMVLDRSTRFNLEITETIRDRKRRGSLLWAIDRTKTAMGGRLLRSWLEQPLINRAAILRRQNSVAALYERFILRESLQEALIGLYDIERLSGRIASGSVSPRDLAALRGTLERIPSLLSLLETEEEAGLSALREKIYLMPELTDLLNRAIVDDPPLVITDGGIIRDGYNGDVDELRDITIHGRDYILSLEAKEREETGIRNLKVGYNRVFGYYYEVSKGQLDKVPEHYTRRQTLVNAERFITPELKEKEDKIIGAEHKLKTLEHELFSVVRETVSSYLPKLQSTAEGIATLDVLLSFANVAERHRYCRPTILEDDTLVIENGRHAVVERILSGENDFVANSLELNGNDKRLMILTGPNMSGKSTYMRQVALIVLLAQAGSFVPADSASIGIVDRIMTRAGASDDLTGGQSTFMVEMSEMAAILDQATPRSLLILDEIGRGTGTSDGLSIAWSVMEYIADTRLLGARTLFATHYHELIDLGNTLPGVFNCHVDVSEQDGDIVFLHRVRPGGADNSYGIDVAKLAGMPDVVVVRAKELMEQIERNKGERRSLVKRSARNMDGQLDLFSEAYAVRIADTIIERLEEADVDHMRPVDAYSLLIDLKDLATKRKRQSGQE